MAEAGYVKTFCLDRTCLGDTQDEKPAESEPSMKRVLNLFDLTAFGFAAIIGGGIFVVTGLQAKTNAGPAVMLSYVLSGFVALLTALCYAEFASEVTATGGAFFYTTAMYGRGLGWFVGANIIIEYLLAGATVAKGFTSYLTNLCQQPPGAWQFCIANCGDVDSEIIIDPVAFGLIIFLTLLLIFGAKESFLFNAVTVLLSLIAICMCIFAGAAKVNPANYTDVPGGFFPFGVKGVFQAAASVFFAYVGFDMIANGAEEAKNPKRDIPLATVLSLFICTGLYVGASTVIVGMVPYPDINPEAPFSVALQDVGYNWGAIIVSIGASAGTMNSAFADLYALSRLIVILGRANLFPPALAHVNKRGVPLVALVTCCVIMGVLALLVPLAVLADIVSMGTLSAFALVDVSIAVRARWRFEEGTGKGFQVFAASFLVLAGAVGASFSYYYATDAEPRYYMYGIFGGIWLLGVVWFYFIPSIYKTKGYVCPLNPVLPCFGAACCVFLIGTLGPTTWIAWCYAMAAALGVFGIQLAANYKTWWPEYQEKMALTSMVDGKDADQFLSK